MSVKSGTTDNPEQEQINARFLDCAAKGELEELKKSIGITTSNNSKWFLNIFVGHSNKIIFICNTFSIFFSSHRPISIWSVINSVCVIVVPNAK